MSDVMKQVVQEILQGNKTIVSRKVEQPNKITENPALAHIKRPNYQRMHKEERLGFKQKNPKSPNMSSKSIKKQNRSSLQPRQFNEESISALRSLALAQGKVPNQNSFTGNDSSNASKIIGKTRNGGTVWFFPQLVTGLRSSFGRMLNNEAVGVVSMTECLPSQLLMINEVIRNNQGMKFSVSWTKDAISAFTAELYDENTGRLEQVMFDLYQQLNRRSLKAFEAYTLSSPDRWLAGHLDIGKSVESIAVLEGIPYYTSIVLMDTLLKRHDGKDFNFEIQQNYLLLSGKYDIVSSVIDVLKREAAKLISLDRRGG